MENHEHDTTECVACGKTIRPGDLGYGDVNNSGFMHADCAGTDPEDFTDAEGEPLPKGASIPKPYPY
ncbi:hypothetical protein ACQKQD_18230 [Methylobacterium sp. NPDC080182]|uniref:hypothetical protein n=1 Tax=Methylobacterium sp. NPDC080182 TaxID=3390590 RepID=UPI003CFCFA97